MSQTQQIQQRWIDSLKAGEFQGLANEIKESNLKLSSEKLDVSLSRLLVVICGFVADQKKLAPETIQDLRDIIRVIYHKLVSIPDPVKFFLSLYHVIRIFCSSKSYQAALEITDYFLPGTLWYSRVGDPSSSLTKLTNLWATSLISFLKSFDKLDDNQFKSTSHWIEYQLKLRLLCGPSSHRSFINDLDSYYKIVKSLNNGKYEDKFRCLMMDTLTFTKISLSVEDKYRSYEAFLRLITEILVSKINIDGVYKIASKIRQVFDPFREAVKVDKEVDRCFKIYELMCSILTRSVLYFTKDAVDATDKCIEKLDYLANEYGTHNAVRHNLQHGCRLLHFVLIYWDNYAKAKEKFDIPLEHMPKLLSLIIHQSDLISRQPISSCSSCSSSECTIRRDLYNSTGIKIRILAILARIDATSDDLRRIAVSVFKDSVDSITELRDNKCESWLRFWSLCTSRAYNILLHYEKLYYQDCRLMSELMCRKIRSFGIEKLFDEKENFLAVCLHRLSSAHFHNENYQEAMTVSALSAYVGYSFEECPAFRMWANVKYRYSSAHGVTILDCLARNDVGKQFGIKVTLDNNQKRLICLREIKGLENASINMVQSIIPAVQLMETLDPDPMEYAQAVHLLGYHLLDLRDTESIKQYITKAQSQLKKANKTPASQLMYGNLLFYAFVQRLADIRRATETEMETSTMRLHSKTPSNGSASNVVPAYSLININTSADLEIALERVLDIWTNYCSREGIIESFGKFLTPKMMIRLVITAGEYAKFYHFRGPEITAWKLAMSLAKKFDDDLYIIYVTGRSIMSRHIKTRWITLAEECVAKLIDTSDEKIIACIAMFKLSLSSYYFYLERVDEAKKLFDEAMEMPRIKFTKNLPTYLLAMDISISHRLNYYDKADNLKYSQSLVEGLYTMILIEDEFMSHDFPREVLLYRLDTLFQFTNHISLRMNSLVSYREISAHLSRRLGVVQKLGSVLHVAECLKNLCFIDLSRNQLEDCEVKLQGLEHILKLDVYDFGANTTSSKAAVNVFYDSSPVRMIESVRDIPQNDASPVLISKVFSSPDFMEHESKCKCFKCTNFAYKYLVFSCTHIRAQLYAAQNNFTQALQHFHGAFQIIKKLLNVQVESFEITSHQYVEYVLFLLDFARFIKYSIPEGREALSIVVFALNICEKHKIKNHPVYLSIKEMIFEYRFQETFGPDQYAKFVVPGVKEENVDDYLPDSGDICTTPIKSSSGSARVKQRYTPPILTLTKAEVNTVQEDQDCLTPVYASDDLVKIEKKKPTKVTRIKPIRRKISDSEYLSPSTASMENKNPDKLNTDVFIFGSDDCKEDKSNSCKKNSVKSTRSRATKIKNEVKTVDKNTDSKSRKKSTATAVSSRESVKIKNEVVEVIDLDEDINSNDINYNVSKYNSKSTDSYSSTKDSGRIKSELETVVENLEAVHISESKPSVRKVRNKSSADSIPKAAENKSIKTGAKARSASTSTSKSKVIKEEVCEDIIDASYVVEPRRSRRVASKSESDKSKFNSKILKPRN
ncbi:uncharacterized protein LOC130664108 [Microplitis mediator]|uniref:uncharacterized protein LOC130664108 n=1 Tax=Microplitis mediator TaxID=375433 RepID=UPI0025572C0B|nr:uncharacterized protein LOC130664108 [Microplitis mediator]